MALLDVALVPLDGSPVADQLLPFIERRARGTRIFLLHMVDDEARTALGAPVAAEDPSAVLTDASTHNRLEVARTRLALAGATVQLEVRAGGPADGIVARALALGATAIVMGSHGRSGVRRMVRGSVAEQVLRTAEVPLLLVTSSARAETERLTRILVPLDGTDRSAAVLPSVRDLARADRAEVILLRVWSGIPVDTPDTLDRCRAELEEDGLRVRIRRKPAVDPAREILAAAAGEDVDLVAMSTGGRRGMERIAPGSVAEQILRSCRASLLVVPVK